MATATVEWMARLWQVEKTVRAQSPDAHVAARQQASAAIVADLFDLWQQTLRLISSKSKWPRPFRAVLSFNLTDGRIELNSSIVELASRPRTTRKKNSLFAAKQFRHFQR